MTMVNPVFATSPRLAPLPAEAVGEPWPSLPEPTTAAGSPQDLIGILMKILLEMNQLSVQQTEQQLTRAQEQMKEQLDRFLQQAAQAAAAAKQAQKEGDGGWFSDLVSSIGDLFGEVTGTVTDFTVDSVTGVIDATVAVAEGQNVWSAIQTELAELAHNGSTADSVKGFTAGTLNMSGALLEFSVRVALAGTDGQPPWEGLEQDATQLWQTFKKEILNNPEFWEVAGWIAKGVSLALAAMSGGALACVAIAVFLLCEANERYGWIGKAFGEKAAPYVQVGLQLTSAALMGASAASAGGATDWAQMIQGGIGAAGCARGVYQSYCQVQAGQEQAAALERQADLQTTLNRMHQLQRLIDDLIASLEEHSDNRTTDFELGSELAQTQAATETATVMRA
jgi:hypothetical protein